MLAQLINAITDNANSPLRAVMTAILAQPTLASQPLDARTSQSHVTTTILALLIAANLILDASTPLLSVTITIFALMILASAETASTNKELVMTATNVQLELAIPQQETVSTL
jgi:hypothetical protein